MALLLLRYSSVVIIFYFLGYQCPEASGNIFTETFDTDPTPRGWAGVGNAVGGNNYSFSSLSTNAGGSAGEVGGTFARRNSFHYYGDTTLGGTLSLENTLHSSGKFSVGNRSIASTSNLIGFFNTSPSTPPFSNVFDLVLGEPDIGESDYRIRLRLLLSDGTQISSVEQTTFSDGQYQWDFNYNPNSGTAGTGTLQIFDSSNILLQSHTLELTNANRVEGAIFDGFGMLGYTSVPPNASNHKWDVYMDDISYTVVPEPSSFELLLSMGVIFSLIVIHTQRKK